MKTILRTGFLALAVILALAVSASAGSLEDGLVAYARGNYATALNLWQPHADQGHAEAQNNLGVIYANGQGVPRDDAEAVKWWRKAGEQGNALAQFNLGVSYKTGWGVPQDYVSAHMWLNLAAAAGYETASKIRDIAASKMTPDQIAEAQRMAREWMAKHQRRCLLTGLKTAAAIEADSESKKGRRSKAPPQHRIGHEVRWSSAS